MFLKDVINIKKTGVVVIFFFVLLMSFFIFFKNVNSVSAACLGGVKNGIVDIGEICDPDIPCLFGGQVCDATCSVLDNSCCFNANPCNQDPAVAITPIAPSVAIGTPVTYTVTVTNNDNGVCGICPANRNFDLSIASLSAGLNNTGVFISDPLTVNSGGSNSTTFEITSDAEGLGLGNYNFTVQAVEGGNSGSGSGIYNINAIDVEICDNGIDDNGKDGTDCVDPYCLSDPFCCGDGSVDGAEVCDTNLPISCSAPTPVCLNDCTDCVAELPGCAIGTGNCDGIAANGCETDLFTDNFNCGSCGNKCKAGYCAGGKCPTLSEGGIVPCGRLVDDPSTNWVELQPCKICHAVILASEIINFLMELVALIAILAIIVAGLIHIKAGGDTSLVLAAKQNINKILFGFAIVFIAWVMINVSMVLFGFNDPLGDGSWEKFSCDLGPFVYCGDGIVQNPNDLGEMEECEASEPLNDYAARNSLDPALDTTIKLWAEDVSRCNSSCKIACKNDPLASKIGEGCFLAANPCQKGRYACDLEGGGVSCLDIYGDPKYDSNPWYVGTPLYDYCCESMAGTIANSVPTGNPHEWKMQDVNPDPLVVEPLVFTIERSSFEPFYCQDVCALVGKVCVGVGFSNPTTMSCRYVIHDEHHDCVEPGNSAATNCKASFNWRNPNECSDGFAMSFGVRETACYCAF